VVYHDLQAFWSQTLRDPRDHGHRNEGYVPVDASVTYTHAIANIYMLAEVPGVLASHGCTCSYLHVCMRANMVATWGLAYTIVPFLVYKL
jgi:hypothetical protein